MISTTGEYALRAAVYLARHARESHRTADIAEAACLPAGYLAKVLHLMACGGVVESQRGMHGGFRLARPIAQISVLEVLESVGAGPRPLHECPAEVEGHEEWRVLQRLVEEARGREREAYARTDLGALVAQAAGAWPPAVSRSTPTFPPENEAGA